MSEHIVPVKIYLTIFGVLLLGTALTVLAAFHDFTFSVGGVNVQLNTIIALAIATTKATFVVLYFMHLRYSSRLTWVVLCSALFWLAIMFSLTLADYWSRGWVEIG